MKRILMRYLCVIPFVLGGCASSVRLENVAGSWSCPRIDGICADISAIDAGLGAGFDAAPLGVADPRGRSKGAFITASSDGTTGYTPARSADEVARIVFAPMVDASGHYHGAREVFAVMTPGTWIAAPVMAATAPQPVALPRPPREENAPAALRPTRKIAPGSNRDPKKKDETPNAQARGELGGAPAKRAGVVAHSMPTPRLAPSKVQRLADRGEGRAR
ncbi:MAG: TraV family lipoprotein [Pseudomonadota bacterium]